MTTHSRILTWRTPWTQEPGGLQSMGCNELDMTEVTEPMEGVSKILFALLSYLSCLSSQIIETDL